MSNQQIGSLITSHIITAFGAGILYGLYLLAGDYLTTFFFMIIFAVALASIRFSVVQSIEKLYSENKNRWNGKIYILHQFKFGITCNIILGILYTLRYPATILSHIKKIFQISSIPYIFILYLLIIKLKCLPQVIFWDILFWMVIDLIRLIIYPFRKRELNDIGALLNWINTSKLFNTLLFASVLLGMILIIPIAIALIYKDIMIYKEDLTPKLQNYTVFEEYKHYISPEFLLSQLQGQYLSESTIQQLSSYLNQTSLVGTEDVSVNFLEIFYGEYAQNIFIALQDCLDSKYCKLMVLASNYDKLNDQIYEYGQYGLNYINAILPQLKQFASVIGLFLMNVFKGSISFLVKFILFQQGVMYLLTESSFYEFVSSKDTNLSFKATLVSNISRHITGVFVSLFTILMQHFMLSYIFLDILKIQLAFIQSFLIGLLSLTQIVDPGITYILISGIWWLAGFFSQASHEFCMNDALTIIFAILFYFSSGSIYLNTFKKQLGDAYWSGMSVILGYISFQWEGLIIGPLLVGGVRTLYEILVWYIDDKPKQIVAQPQIQKIEPAQNVSKNQQKKK